MLPRSGGTLALEGVPVDRFKPTEWRRRVCLVPQAASLVPGTVRDNLLFPWTLKVNAGSPKPDDDVLNEMLSLAMLDWRDARSRGGSALGRPACSGGVAAGLRHTTDRAAAR